MAPKSFCLAAKIRSSGKTSVSKRERTVAGFPMLFIHYSRHRSIKTYSTTGKLLKFQYKVSIPLRKINGVNERLSMKRPSNKYVELATIDDFNFWFMGFINFKKTLRCLHQATNLGCLINS
ncbi:hypothetical protein L1987_17005 [Smallanthus sonchifolius]|uniref:Uncharacterized protein n=1 Tax=Smallanthus sonchifolius TaxID=185202 RepID=A0ACB9IXU4_9ASTR|nr:hypothetical protein L1987_17005 [Smallanthus sonchifolius]